MTCRPHLKSIQTTLKVSCSYWLIIEAQILNMAFPFRLNSSKGTDPQSSKEFVMVIGFQCVDRFDYIGIGHGSSTPHSVTNLPLTTAGYREEIQKRIFFSKINLDPRILTFNHDIFVPSFVSQKWLKRRQAFEPFGVQNCTHIMQSVLERACGGDFGKALHRAGTSESPAPCRHLICSIQQCNRQALV